jgi:hypothetical protein
MPPLLLFDGAVEGPPSKYTHMLMVFSVTLSDGHTWTATDALPL